jgi:hypothetical protein
VKDKDIKIVLKIEGDRCNWEGGPNALPPKFFLRIVFLGIELKGEK